MVVNKFYEDLFNKINHYLVKYPYSQKYASVKIIFFLTKKLFQKKYKSSFKDKDTHICVTLYGRIGDFVIAIRYLKSLAFFLNKKINVRVEKKYENIITELLYCCDFAILAEDRTYDIEISLCRFPKLIFIDSSRRLDARCIEYCNEMEKFYRMFYTCYQNDYLGYTLCKIRHIHRINQADFNLILNLENTSFNITTRLNEEKVLKKFNLIKNHYITLQSGGGDLICKNDVRQVKSDEYKKVIKKYLGSSSTEPLVQIGVRGHLVLDFVNLNLLGKTSFQEMLCILKNSKLHIQQEGGLVHLRHFLSAKASVVFWGPTDQAFYAYKENYSEEISKCKDCCCEWIIPDWINECILNHLQNNYR